MKLAPYLAEIAKSRLLAPNLKEMVLHVYSSTDRQNIIARCERVCPGAWALWGTAWRMATKRERCAAAPAAPPPPLLPVGPPAAALFCGAVV